MRTRILDVQAKAGFVPNVFLALAHRPAEWRAFMAYHDALLVKDTGSLSKGEREMIIVVTSAANQCLYCVVAHGAILRVYEKKPLIADQLAVNYRKADITPRQRAMLDFAFKITTASHLIDDSDYAALRAPRLQRRRHLGHRRHQRLLRPLQPPGQPERHAAQRRVLPDGALAAAAEAGTRCPALKSVAAPAR